MLQSEFVLSPQVLASGQLDESSAEDAAQLFRVHGTLMLRNALNRDLVSSMRRSFLEECASRDPEVITKESLLVGDKRLMITVPISGPFNDPRVYASPLFLPIVKQVLGDDCVLQSFGGVCAFPGSEIQHVHRDHPNLFPEEIDFNAFLPPFALHVVIPLVDLNEECGTTALWEGSHRLMPRQRELQKTREELDEGDPLEGATLPYPRTGDCYFMDFRLRHRGTPNTSKYPRPILYMVFSRKWFQDFENFTVQRRLQIDQSNLDKIPEEHRGLFQNARPAV